MMVSIRESTVVCSEPSGMLVSCLMDRTSFFLLGSEVSDEEPVARPVGKSGSEGCVSTSSGRYRALTRARWALGSFSGCKGWLDA